MYFHGIVTTAVTGERLPGVTVSIEVPAIGWVGADTTDENGYYSAPGIPKPSGDQCRGLVVIFSRTGYEPIRILEPHKTCEGGFQWVSPAMTPDG